MVIRLACRSITIGELDFYFVFKDLGHDSLREEADALRQFTLVRF